LPSAEKQVDQISYPDFQYYLQNNHVFTDVAAAPNSISTLVSDFGELWRHLALWDCSLRS